ncbi:DUF6896 domain-containing protein [Chitinophaga sp. GCM10012297]|uniref:DUF6896 domain-containing protein n=1 Tax=Chitinophaga chungangae TaxID=2821488 RepID=A0ABS3YHB5_9BACT|nr:hypothetical protein [Chitinophaga chungangae]MBO9154079.1 hypothetical protein [Chitinophaga chungangae]
MITDVSFFENVLFEYTDRIHIFNDSLVRKYKLKDIPYNESGKSFPKIGELYVEDKLISYRFHGRGATIFWDKAEIKFDIDALSNHKIITSSWPYLEFLSHFIDDFKEEEYPFSFIDQLLIGFEERGLFMERKINEKVYHINEAWYEHRKSGLAFSGDNKKEIDW